VLRHTRPAYLLRVLAHALPAMPTLHEVLHVRRRGWWGVNVTNDDGTPILYANVRVASGGVMTFTGNVPCVSGMHLAATNDASAKIEARRFGTSDAFSNLQTAPIDLTAYAGETVKFEFKVTGLSVSSSAHVAIPVRVTFNP
jgi:hypothetical protein